MCKSGGTKVSLIADTVFNVAKDTHTQRTHKHTRTHLHPVNSFPLPPADIQRLGGWCLLSFSTCTKGEECLCVSCVVQCAHVCACFACVHARLVCGVCVHVVCCVNMCACVCIHACLLPLNPPPQTAHASCLEGTTRTDHRAPWCIKEGGAGTGT